MTKNEFEKSTKTAIRRFWSTRKSALAQNKQGSKKDAGTRGGATAGKNLDGFSALICKVLRNAAVGKIEIHETKKLVTLPGYFRPTKQWDIVAMRGSHMLAAIELKSLGGPSFGNNANNRCEEAIGSALDFRTVQREGGFGKGANPFLGYLILVHDEHESSKPPARQPASVHFECDPEFEKASYQRRMAILCERMIQENLYDQATAIASPSSAGRSGAFSELSKSASFHRLLVQLAAHVRAETSLHH